MSTPAPLERADERLAGRHAVYLKREDVHKLGALNGAARCLLEAHGDRGATAVVGNGALLGGIGLELCDRAPATLRVGVQFAQPP